MNEQRLVLVRGLPGSCKTTLAEMLDWYEDAIMFSTDDLFMVDGEYKFDRDQKKEIASKRSTYYQSSKSHILKYPNLEYLVRGESNAEDTHTLRLIARFVDED